MLFIIYSTKFTSYLFRSFNYERDLKSFNFSSIKMFNLIQLYCQILLWYVPVLPKQKIAKPAVVSLQSADLIVAKLHIVCLDFFLEVVCIIIIHSTERKFSLTHTRQYTLLVKLVIM